jgi:2',3'-cyclic-nucleotide 2'-phosphodiesterase (5'-nucleotidase family)
MMKVKFYERINRQLLIAICFSVLSSCIVSSETVSYQYQNLKVTEISDSIKDPVFDNALAPYKDSVEHVMSEVLAESEVEMTSYRPESPLSNFISDMVLQYSIETCRQRGYQFTPQFALINTGSLRTSFPKGNITMRNAFELMPFDNTLVLLRLTGEQVQSLANYIVIREGEGVAGITFGMDGDHADDIKIQGMMIDLDKNYWMATSDYVANGGDGMKVLTWADQRIDTGIKMRDLIIEKLRESKKNGVKLFAKTDGRIYHVQ